MPQSNIQNLTIKSSMQLYQNAANDEISLPKRLDKYSNNPNNSVTKMVSRHVPEYFSPWIRKSRTFK